MSTTVSINGMPTLMAGTAPLPAPVFCLMHDQALHDNVVASLYRNGIGAFAVRSMMGVGDGRQTDESIERAVARLANVARVAPDAWLMADCDFFPAEPWLIGNPHEGFITADRNILVLGKDGESDRRDYVRMPGPSLADAKGKPLNGEDVRVLYGRRRVSPFSEIFARLTSDNAVVAAMRRDAAGTTHVVYNLPVLNTVIFRALAQKAGCHLFTQTDGVVYASKGLVLLHAAYSGIHRLFFPRNARLFDLRENKRVQVKERQLALKLTRGETRLYRLEFPARGGKFL